jgi:hypothetical protein
LANGREASEWLTSEIFDLWAEQLAVRSLRIAGVLTGPSAALRRGGERRILASVLVSLPPLPLGGVVRPLCHLDAPRRWLGGQEKGFALRSREAARDCRFGVRLK